MAGIEKMIHSLFRKALKNVKNNYSISFMIAFIITHKSTKFRILFAYLFVCWKLTAPNHTHSYFSFVRFCYLDLQGVCWQRNNSDSSDWIIIVAEKLFLRVSLKF